MKQVEPKIFDLNISGELVGLIIEWKVSTSLTISVHLSHQYVVECNMLATLDTLG